MTRNDILEIRLASLSSCLGQLKQTILILVDFVVDEVCIVSAQGRSLLDFIELFKVLADRRHDITCDIVIRYSL